jgi:hypothetical protein
MTGALMKFTFPSRAHRTGLVSIALVALATTACAPIASVTHSVTAKRSSTHPSTQPLKAQPVAAAKKTPATVTSATPATTVSPPVKRPPLTIGVDTVSGYFDLSQLATWEATVGRTANILQTTTSSWAYSDPSLTTFPASRAKSVSQAGSTLELTWQPQDPYAGLNQPQFSLKSITTGQHDAYIKTYADAIKASKQNIRLRLAHEMNGSWMLWSEGRNGNSAGDFIAAWRHIHDVFAQEGVTNVTWVWAPNIDAAGSPSVKSLYPGDSYVDVIGMDGYSYTQEGCRSAQAIFTPLLTDIRSFSQKPVYIEEVGASAACSNRASWINAFFSWVKLNSIVGFNWWERPSTQGDYRLLNDPVSLAAFKLGLANS